MIIPHIFVWGSCFLLCTSVRRPPAPSALRPPRSAPPTLSHAQLSHTQLSHTQLYHMTSTLLLRGRRGTYGTHCVAGVALGDIDVTSVWQALHLWRWAGSGGAHHTTLSQHFHAHSIVTHTQFFHTPTFSHTQYYQLSYTALSHNLVMHNSSTHNSFTHSTFTDTTFTHTHNSFTHKLETHTHTCSEQSLRILMWNATDVQKHQQ